MPLHLRKSIIRASVLNGVIMLVISVALAFALGDVSSLSLNTLIWPVTLAVGVAIAAWFLTMQKVKQGTVGKIVTDTTYERVDALIENGALPIHRSDFDTYAAQLASRGFRALGYFRSLPATPGVAAVAALHTNADETILIEVQHITVADLPGIPKSASGVHFAIASMLAGGIRVTTTDHEPLATHYLIRGDCDVSSCHPGAALLDLLARHESQLSRMRERLGKAVLPGMSVERYVLAQRLGHTQAKARLASLSGWQIAGKVDAFQESRQDRWSPAAEVLRGLPNTDWRAVDALRSASERAAVIDAGSAEASMADATHTAATSVTDLQQAANASAEVAKEHAIVASGVSWMYWIAGLTVATLVVAAFGSTWGFAISLALPYFVAGIFGAMPAETTAGAAAAPTLGLWIATLVLCGLFAFLAWRGRRPSVAPLVTGAVLYALDTLVYVLVFDVLGIALHALALFFMVRAVLAARRLQRGARQ